MGRLCEPNTTIALQGPLGAGKTQLTKGIAEGLGITDRGKVTSPTFVLEQEYDGRLKIRHLDAYRLSGPHDLWDIGIDEMCKAGGVVVLEWPERAAEALPEDTLWIHLEPTGELSRRLQFTSRGPQSAKLLERLKKQLTRSNSEGKVISFRFWVVRLGRLFLRGEPRAWKKPLKKRKC